jgi:hypothetical protein
MPLFSFRTENCGRACTSDPCELANRDEAWKELTRVCGDLIGESCRNLKQDSEWSIELLDGTNAPLFRIRLVAETLITLAWPFVLACLAPAICQPLLI